MWGAQWVFKWTYFHLLLRTRTFSSWWCKFASANSICTKNNTSKLSYFYNNCIMAKLVISLVNWHWMHRINFTWYFLSILTTFVLFCVTFLNTSVHGLHCSKAPNVSHFLVFFKRSQFAKLNKFVLHKIIFFSFRIPGTNFYSSKWIFSWVRWMHFSGQFTVPNPLEKFFIVT